MAIAFDASTDLGISASGDGTKTTTTAHTVSGANTILIVATASSMTNGSTSVSGITYAGVALTQVTTDTQIPTNNYLGLWYLINPTTGTNNIAITLTQSGGGRVWGGAASYTGVKQSGQPDAFNTGTATAQTSLTVAVTTVADNCKLVGNMGSLAVGPVTAGTNTQSIQSYSQANIIDSPTAQTPAGSHSLQGTQATPDNFAGVVMSISPFVSSFVASVMIS